MENPLWKALNFNDRSEDEELTQVLKKVPIFQDLDSKEIQKVSDIVYPREYKKDEVIFHQGDPGLGMYIISKGEVEIVEEENEEPLNQFSTLSDNDFLGEMALLDDKPRSATAIARKRCKALGFFRPELMDLLKKEPKTGNKILLNLAKILAERLRENNEYLIELHNKLESDG